MRKIIVILLLLLSAWVNAQINLTWEDSSYVNASTTWVGLNVPKTSPTNFIFRRNLIDAVNSDATYMLLVGSDLPTAYDNNLDGAIITGNKFYYHGDETSDNEHVIQTGYNVDYTINYNYFINGDYQVIYEGTAGMANSTGGLSYNIFKKGQGRSVSVGGTDSVKIYNNTFYSSRDRYSSAFIRAGLFTQVEPYEGTDYLESKNNVFYTENYHAIYQLDDTAASTFVSDYNVFWCETCADNKPVFYITGSGYITWDEWQAMGYDAHSIVMDPNFIDTVGFVPANALYYGTDLGTEFDDGLATDAEWVVGSQPETQAQGTSWQSGAYVYSSGPSSTAKYVSPTGDDGAAGTFAAPWATWQKAFTTAEAGDTVYFREGVWYPTSFVYTGYYDTGIAVYYNPSNGYGHDGTRAEPIVYMNYPGETPILDCSLITTRVTGSPTCAVHLNTVDNVKIKGLHIRNVFQIGTTAYTIFALRVRYSNNVTFDQCVIYNTGGEGSRADYNDTINYINCDSYNHCDTIANTLPGSYGTGFSAIGSTDTVGLVTYTGCRVWQASDQGFGASCGFKVVWDNCWSFSNGRLQGDGHGWKTSVNGIEDTATIKYVEFTIKNCLAFSSVAGHSSDGFTTNETENSTTGLTNGYKVNFYNNIAYDMGRAGWNCNDVDGHLADRTFANNISYANVQTTNIDGTVNTYYTNSWNGGVTVTSADFISLDTTGVTGARQADGSLPSLSLFKLVETSDLIDAGTDVGIDYEGDVPDLGPYEFDQAIAPALPQISTYAPYGITTNRIITGGYLIYDGGGTISAKGVCWGSAENPDLTDNVISGGTGTGNFIIEITGLEAFQTYHVRAYVTNETGTSYGADERFTTSSSSIIKSNGKIVKR